MQIKQIVVALAISLGGLTANSFGQAPLTIGASDGPVTIVNVEVTNFRSNQAHVAPGAAFGLHFDYNIVDAGCPDCIDQIQIGFANALPTVCAYDGIDGTHGVTRPSPDLVLTAPSTNGIYYIAFDRSQAFSCPTNAWWNGTPQPSQYIAAIAVY